ncbi:hypothetical protein SADUNF_Sadunf10G0048100 [Salix dunnii]|uniref:Uncharacterized protein n=1 Tax=Salix dunnii TaxID=1413687 RepID=A0A835MRC0_9ROSI|nr:hypothetical protein SADUNF_Sadunf10G0048100 [Salix dunnii]
MVIEEDPMPATASGGPGGFPMGQAQEAYWVLVTGLSLHSCYHLYGFILSFLVSGAGHCLVFYSTTNRMAPQEYPSVIVLFIAEAPLLRARIICSDVVNYCIWFM